MTQRIHGSSEMADRIRAYDWSVTPLGAIDGWPQSLTTAVDLMLASAQPAYIGWGADLISLYNDGYVAIAGEKHPTSLGSPYREMWPEIWDEFRPVADAVMAGDSRYFVDQPVPLAGRPGRPLSWFTFSWTPLRDDGGLVAGFYCAAVETTDRVLADRERDSSYRALFETIDEGYLLADVIFDDASKAIDIEYVDANPAATRMVGADLKGRRLRDVSTDYEDYWYEIWGRVARTGVGERLERYAAPEQRWYDFFVFKPDPDDDASRRVAVLFHDASRRKAAEAALRESETRNRLLIESWAQAAWEADASGIVVKDSPSWRAYTGQTLEEWLGDGWLDAIHPDERAYAERQWREAVAASGQVNAEFRLRAPTGGWRWTNVRAAPLVDAAGHVEKWLGLNIDIDDRKRAEQALRASEEKYRTLFENMGQGYALGEMIRDEKGRAVDLRYLELNPAFERLSGIPVAQAQGRTVLEVYGEVEREWFEVADRVARLKIPQRVEYEIGAIRRWFQMDFYPAEGDRYLGLFEEVTERKRAEQALRESEERQAFLLKLSDALRPLSDPMAAQEMAMRVLGEHLHVNRAFYGSAEDDHDTLLIGPGYSAGTFPLEGEVKFSNFDLDMAAWYQAGRTYRIEDTQQDARFGSGTKASFVAIDVGAAIGIPLVKNGVVRAIVSLHQTTPRHWTDAEVALAEEVAERTWAAVERARAEASLRESEERQAFLLTLSDALAGLNDPVEIEEAASRLLGEYLGALRVGYGEVEGDELVIRADYANGVSSLRGRYPIDAFGDALTNIHRDGGTIVVGDPASDPALTETDREEYRALGVAAHVTVAIRKAGRPIISLGVHSDTPRKWSAGEIALIHDVADRTWVAIRRAQVDQTLRDSEDHRAFLLDLSDALRPLTSPSGIQHAAMKLLAERFDVMRAGYLDVDADGDRMTMAAHFQRSAEPVPDRIRLSDYGPDLVASFQSGQTRYVCDTESEVPTEEERAAHRAIGIRAWIIAPLVKDGLLIAIVGVVSDTPREWTPVQVQKVTDLAERTWEAVQRARTEEALRDSEARYRLLFETIDEGFCLCERVSGEPIDYRYIVVNPAFDRQSGLDHPVGKTIREIVPGIEGSTMEIYARVEATGVPEHFTTCVSDLDQWFDVETIPTDQPGRIAMLFRNVTDRKRAEGALRASEERLQTLVTGVPQLVWRAFYGGHWTWASPQWTAFTGQAEANSHGFGWLDAVHPDDREQLKAVWTGAIKRGEFHADFRLYRASRGEYAWFQSRATPVRDDAGRIVEWLGTSTDIDDLRALQERQDTLLAELQHRVRNILAVTRSIISRSDDGQRSTLEYVQHLQGRIAALARTQVLLTRAAGADVDLETLIHDELLAQAASQEKVTISGRDVALSPKIAEVLTLAIHELATNATKYGALSRPDGRIQVNWQVERRDGQEWVSLMWVETGVPIVDAVPRRRGFGAELISRRIPYELKGSGTLEMKAGGVVSRIEFPLLAGSSILQTNAGAR